MRVCGPLLEDARVYAAWRSVMIDLTELESKQAASLEGVLFRSFSGSLRGSL